MKFVITAATDQTAEVAINWGTFIQRIVDFLIISFVVFVMVRSLNTLRDKLEPKKEEEAPAPEAPPAPPADVVLLTEIRDLLKEQNHD